MKWWDWVFMALAVMVFILLQVWVRSAHPPKTKPPAPSPIPPVTTEEQILGELTLIRKMMEEDRKPVKAFERDLKAGRLPALPGVKR